jgi:protease IV
VSYRKALRGCGFLAAIVLLFGFVAFAAPRLWGGASPWFAQARVAVLPVEGVILTDELLLYELRHFLDDPSVQAIVVAIDSPGGAVAPSQSLYQELRRAREEGIPVVAAIGSIGASGGYYIALAADTILAMPGSVTGSIGVIMEFPNATSLLDKVGVSMEVVKSAEHKDAGSPYRLISEGDRSVLQAMVSDVYDQFVSTVAYERVLDEDSVRRLADGRLLSGRQAVHAGLVDRTGNLMDAIAVAGRMAGLGDHPQVVYPPEPRRSLVEVLLGVQASSLVNRLRAGAEPFQGPRLRYIAH